LTARLTLFAVVALVALGSMGCMADDDEPGGRIVVFGSPDVVLIPPTGGKTERLGLGVGEFWQAAFSTDGNRVAYNPVRGIAAGGLTVRTLGGGSPVRIPNQPPQREFASWDFAWAPDGRKLAFVHGANVFVIGTDGQDLRDLGIGSSPSWTPDSRHVVFAHGDNRDSDLKIAVIRADGTEFRLLGRGMYPDVSPSGEDVAYSNASGVFVRALGGGAARLAVPNGFGPVWSPDGRYLAFARYTECGHAACSGRIFVVSAEGGRPHAVGPTVGDPSPPDDWIRAAPEELAGSR
jgi:Tol biopolymer transport system component